MLLQARINHLTVALELAIDALQAAAMDLEAGLEGQERDEAVAAAIAAGVTAKAMLR